MKGGPNPPVWVAVSVSSSLVYGGSGDTEMLPFKPSRTSTPAVPVSSCATPHGGAVTSAFKAMLWLPAVEKEVVRVLVVEGACSTPSTVQV